jgi:hypothetical protein
MAAREVIHFPMSAQLGPRQLLPSRIPSEPDNLIATDLISPYRCRCPRSDFERSCFLPGASGDGQ